MKNKTSILKSTKVRIISIFICIFAMFGLYVYNSYSKVEPTTASQKQIADDNKNMSVTQTSLFKGLENERGFSLNMSEQEVQDAIHKMSHQKIEADRKWGAIQITPERIERLIEIVETNESDYTNSSLYLDILNSWRENDFSSAVSDHNSIWKLQGGTVGKAQGLLSEQEEQKFIEVNFE